MGDSSANLKFRKLYFKTLESSFLPLLLALSLTLKREQECAILAIFVPIAVANAFARILAILAELKTFSQAFSSAFVFGVNLAQTAVFNLDLD